MREELKALIDAYERNNPYANCPDHAAGCHEAREVCEWLLKNRAALAAEGEGDQEAEWAKTELWRLSKTLERCVQWIESDEERLGVRSDAGNEARIALSRVKLHGTLAMSDAAIAANAPTLRCDNCGAYREQTKAFYLSGDRKFCAECIEGDRDATPGGD